MTKEPLDCRGLQCPQPVVETKKKLMSMPAGTLTVLVDNDTAKQNLLKLAASLNMASASREEGGIFAVTLLKNEDLPVANEAGGKTILVTADVLGRGSEELGALLMKSYFYALSESDHIPVFVYLLNSGVKLACEGSAVLDSLEKLATMGVEIYSCGLCLDFFQLKDKLQVGGVTNMYAIVDKLMLNANVVL